MNFKNSTKEMIGFYCRQMLFKPMLYFVYHFIHLSLAAVYSCMTTWQSVKNNVIDNAYQSYYSFSSFQRALHDKTNLVKVPDHLVIVINEKEIDYASLSQLAIWCFLCGVKYVTFTISHGILDRVVLEKKISEMHKTDYLSDIEPISFQTDSVDMKQMGKFNIIFSNVSSEKQKFVDTVQYLVSSSSLADAEKLSIKLFDAAYKEHSTPLVEPSVMLVFGPYYSTFGYSPWELRLTEIFHLQSHQGLSYSDFIHVMRSYSSCKQRIGK